MSNVVEHGRLDKRADVLKIAQGAVDELAGRERVVEPEPHPLQLVVDGSRMKKTRCMLIFVLATSFRYAAEARHR